MSTNFFRILFFLAAVGISVIRGIGASHLRSECLSWCSSTIESRIELLRGNSTFSGLHSSNKGEAMY